MSTQAEKIAEKIHQEAIIIDACCPLAGYKDYFKKWISGGATVVVPTVSMDDLMSVAMAKIGIWFKRIKENPDKLVQILSIEDIYKAKEEGKLGILFAFQNTKPFEDDLNLIEVYYRLGVRQVQLTYNIKNFVGDGCIERTDSGLSQFGLSVIEEMNRVGMVVDLSHTGYKTTMEAIEASKKPVIFSHSNIKAVYDCARNIRDDQILAVAKKNGVIGMNAYPAHISSKERPNIDDLLDHVDYIARLVGTSHISVGLDFWEGMVGVSSLEQAKDLFNRFNKAGAWSDPKAFPQPPWHYPEGLDMPDKLPNLTTALIKRGYSEQDIKNILGGNLIRVYKEVWV